MFATKTSKLAQGILLLVALMLAARIMFTVDGTEFSGGRLTGPLVVLCDCGLLGLVIAVIATYPLPRFSAVIGAMAAALCIPLVLYFIAPGSFHSVFKGEYKGSLQNHFVWNAWSVAALVTFSAVIVVCGFNLRAWLRMAATVRDTITE
jgi:hypothetical protein